MKKTILKTDLFAKTDDITEDKDKSQKIQTVEDSGEKTLSAVSITKEKVQKKDLYLRHLQSAAPKSLARPIQLQTKNILLAIPGVNRVVKMLIMDVIDTILMTK